MAHWIEMTRRAHNDCEVELKFELDKSAARQVRRHSLLSGLGHQTESQRSVYFDTAKGKVHEAGYSLRVRKIGDQYTQTVKANGGSEGLFDRGEWETTVSEMGPKAKALKRTPLAKLKNLDRKVEPVVCSDVQRMIWLVVRDGSIIEVALDSGAIEAGAEKTNFHELELELKNGEPARLFDFARELSEAVPIDIGVLSKEMRGRLLFDGSYHCAHKASALDIDETMDAGQVFRMLVHECVRHFRMNQALIVADRNPEALHQARVAVRRLRTGFSLFRPVIRQGSLEPLRSELHEFIIPFGEARNLDVYLGHQGKVMGWRARRKLTSARDDTYDRIVEALESQRTREMILNLVQWTIVGRWRKDLASLPVKKFARKRFEAMWGKVRQRGSGIADLEEKQLHGLRIAVKKLRYAVDFLAPLYPRNRVHKFTSSLVTMQDCLGLVHDEIVSRQIVVKFGLDGTMTDITSRAGQLNAIERRFKNLKRAGRFWAN